MITYNGTVSSSFSFTASGGGAFATVGVESSDQIVAQFSFAGASVSGNYTSNSTYTVSVSGSANVPSQTFQDTSSGSQSLSGSFPTLALVQGSAFGSTNYTWTFSPDKLQVSVSGTGTYNALQGAISGSGSFSSGGILYADSASNPTIGDWLQSEWTTVLTALQAVNPQAVSQAIAEFTTGGSVTSFLSSLGQTIETGFATTVGRVGSTLVNFGIGALDPDVAKGVAALVRSGQEGTLSINVNQDRQLRQLLDEMDSQFKAPAQPEAVDGNKSTFNQEVTKSSLEVFDPQIGDGYLYESGPSGLKFESFVLPHIIGSDSEYKIFLNEGGSWVFHSEVGAIDEVSFDDPVDSFLVAGVDPSTVSEDTPWISGLSFDETGVFNGSITTLSSDDIDALGVRTDWTTDVIEIEVVASTYQFFVDLVPTAAGFEFLISSEGNPFDLKDPFYDQFNTENKFINFANNLGSFGDGADAFRDKYGDLTFEETVRDVFEEVLGSQTVIDAGGNPEASIGFFLGSQDYYAAVANERVVPSGVSFDQALKVVAVGSILNEAIKAGLGRYSDAIDLLLEEVATTGTSGDLGESLFA